MGNASTLYAFLQKRAESAEMIAGIAGTHTAARSKARHSKFLFMDVPTGEKSVREVEEYRIHPNLRALVNVLQSRRIRDARLTGSRSLNPHYLIGHKEVLK